MKRAELCAWSRPFFLRSSTLGASDRPTAKVRSLVLKINLKSPATHSRFYLSQKGRNVDHGRFMSRSLSPPILNASYPTSCRKPHSGLVRAELLCGEHTENSHVWR